MMYEATMANILQPVIATIKGDLFTARKIPWLSETHFLPLNSTVTEYELKWYGEIDNATARSLLLYGRTMTWSASKDIFQTTISICSFIADFDCTKMINETFY